MIRDLIPPKARRWVYALAGLACPVLPFVPGRWPDIITAVLAGAGFSLAAGNVAKADES